jgi:hypothetical protein
LVDKNKVADELMNEFVKKINDSATFFEGWTRSIQFVFKDINVGYWFKVGNDGHVEKLEKVIKDKKESDGLLIYKSIELLKGLMDKSVGAQSALGSGDLQVEGAMGDLVKLNLAFS